MITNDPLVRYQWHLDNFGQTGGPRDIDLDIQEAWWQTKGRNVVIGMVSDGIQHDHPDLRDRFLPDLSYHFAAGNSNTWRWDDHDTAVAGIAIATDNNGIGVTGIAPQAKFATIGIDTSNQGQDWIISQALSHQRDSIHIYNNSWGPWDSGQGLAMPGYWVRKALEDGVRYGRNGRGSIFVWAAGNGLDVGDNVNYDGYANSRYTIAVTGIDHRGQQGYYSEPGAAIFVSAFSSGDNQGIATTGVTGGGDLGNGYTHSGMTSAATPVVSGVAALMLSRNPNLGWRDVQHILALTAEKNDPYDWGWQTNGAGYHVNHKYGFGAVNAGAAVTTATNWQNVGPETKVSSGERWVGRAIPDNNSRGISASIWVDQTIQVEWAEVVFKASHSSRGDLDVRLISPDGTQSILAEQHDGDTNANYDRWRFSTVRNWGEVSRGNWTLQVSDRAAYDSGSWDSWQLDLYGTNGSNGVNSIDETPAGDPYAPPSNALYDASGEDYLAGTAGADYLLGLGGSDYIWAGAGDDVINGSSGELRGANEWDFLVGGAGADTFILGDRAGAYYSTGGDGDVAYLSDFEVGTDQVVLYGSAADYRLQQSGGGETWLYLQNGEGIAGFVTTAALLLSQFKYLGV